MSSSGPYTPPAESSLRRLARQLREGVYVASSASGLSSAIAHSKWRRARTLILCYHGVSIDDEHEWSDLYVSAELLDRRLAWLRRHDYNVLSLDEAVQSLAAGALPSKSVVLTFDDGAFDFAVRAMPVLAAHRAPATVYLTTYYVQKRLPVFDTMLSYLMWKGAGSEFRIPGMLERLAAPHEEDEASRRTLQFRIMAHARDAGISADEKQRWLQDMASALHVDFDRLLDLKLLHVMSADDVRGLDRSLVDLQLHTHRHRTPHDRELFSREIADNRTAMASLTEPASLRHFCYPSGQYTAEQVRWLADLGIASATTCNPGMAARRDNPLLLPRLIDSESVTDGKFAAWSSGLGALLSPGTG
jgi:peptidoglycan/xylan/chitin deacetylase (PgdA/CDA1 family)